MLSSNNSSALAVSQASRDAPPCNRKRDHREGEEEQAGIQPFAGRADQQRQQQDDRQDEREIDRQRSASG